jgi:Peroxiredoxin
MYGREHWGVIRTTILVDPDGFVRKIWENVKVKDHASNVLHSLIELIRSNK